jgi:Got1/Sft2-like family
VPSSPLETCAHFSPPLPSPALYSQSPTIITRHAQILFLGGLFLIIGPQKTFYFFSRKNKLRGTVCFLGGILLVFLKWPTIGVLVEMFGFLNLFGCVLPPALSALPHATLPFSFFRDFFPVILTFLRQLPFIGQFLNLPYIRPVRPSTLALYPNHLTLTCALWPRVLPARGSFSRFPYLRSVTGTTLISHYSTLLDSTATTVVVNAGFYWILDTGSDWSEHRTSFSRLSSDNSFDVIRSRQHQAVQAFSPFVRVVTPQSPSAGRCAAVVDVGALT